MVDKKKALHQTIRMKNKKNDLLQKSVEELIALIIKLQEENQLLRAEIARIKKSQTSLK